MNPLQALPPWAALLVGALMLAGALLACIGSLGLLRLDTFYQRVHAPTLGTTLGLYLVVVGTLVFFSLDQGRPVLHVIVLGVCVTLTTPITLMLLVRAALKRDRLEDAAGAGFPEESGVQGRDARHPGSPD